MSNVRATIPDMEAYYADNNSYRGATTSVLRSTYDRGLPASGVSVVSAGAENYCLQGTVDGQTASVSGPGGTVKQGPCP